eukprot:5300661-Pleurochrysis_carterae.AAC.3
MLCAPTVLCGTMFGHRRFRHRLFLSSDKLQFQLSCAHEGKHAGSRGHSKDQTFISNMYGPYRWHRAFRGSTGRSFVAVKVFHRCKLPNGSFLTLPQRRMRPTGRSRLRIRCKTCISVSFASLTLLPGKVRRRGHSVNVRA